MKNNLTKHVSGHTPALLPFQQLKLVTGKITSGIVLTFLSGIFMASCQDHEIPSSPPVDLPGQSIQSNNPKPDWGPTITPQNLAIIEELDRLNPVPLYLLTPQEARMKPSVKDAVTSLLDRNHIAPPKANVSVSKRFIPGAGGVPIEVALYKPNDVSGPMPVIVYYHGGGWVIANSDVYEASTLALAQNTKALVVSVNYRLAPENKFPTAHMDAYAAYKWVRSNQSELNGNGKVAVAGESAGGNMAVTVSMMARDSSLTLPLHILSVYPVANNDLNTPSYIQYANAKPLSKPLVQWFVDKYFNTMADGDSPLISLVDVANLSGLPPTTIIGAEIDPLQSDGMQLRDKLQQSGVQVTYQLYEGVTHEFFGTYAIEPKAAQAQTLAATQLLNAFK
ncbi:alpha/beta hydrolase [Spirosoma sp. KNUC1025]|uniref:alpha/beta hydrolase n=1 Tax=Spirosoma sp. KNUC1025 TaxID=2894082 RepID=UPI0038686212|nr:alpha/beta hydrolase [Spirosoma sp. KNUC1025]